MAGPASNIPRTTDGAVAGSILYGFDVVASTAAVVELRHGTSVAGALIGGVQVGAAGSDARWYGPNGIACPDGIWVEVVSGTVTVIAHTG